MNFEKFYLKIYILIIID